MSAPNGSNGYTKLIAACGLVLAIVASVGSLTVTPLVKDGDRKERLIEKQADEIKELLQFKSLAITKFGSIEAEQVKSYSERKELIDNTMTRNEITAAMSAQQKQTEDIRKDIGSAYSLGDKLKELQRQVEMLSNKNNNTQPAH